MMRYDVVVIGGGPSGIAAATKAARCGASVLLLEREARLGGILKQCIHDGFGVIRFSEKLSGPEYVERFIDELNTTDVEVSLLTFLSEIKKVDDEFLLTLITREGIKKVTANAVVLAMGCRERTARQVFIHGSKPSGVFTAGNAQYFTNILGKLPTKRCVILGSGDIGLIMARRLTLEGATVEGVYEIQPAPSGLMRNIAQCLDDFDIPLHLSHTVTRVFGERRLTAVEVAKVDKNKKPIAGTERRIDCDALILSVGLIPENEVAEQLGVPIDKKTKGAVVDQTFLTRVGGVYAAGNALHVHDLVDYVSEGAEIAGEHAAKYRAQKRTLVELTQERGFLYAVPQVLSLGAAGTNHAKVYFRAAKDMQVATFVLTVNGEKRFEKRFTYLRPPEMECVTLDIAALNLTKDSKVAIALVEKEGE